MTNMNKKSDSFQVPFISKIAYGMGDVGCNFSWMFVGNFLMIFYTDVFGIGMSAVASGFGMPLTTLSLAACATRLKPDGEDTGLGCCSQLPSRPLY